MEKTREAVMLLCYIYGTLQGSIPPISTNNQAPPGTLTNHARLGLGIPGGWQQERVGRRQSKPVRPHKGVYNRTDSRPEMCDFMVLNPANSVCAQNVLMCCLLVVSAVHEPCHAISDLCFELY